MFTVIAMAACTTAAFIITFNRAVGWDVMLKHSNVIDVVFTLGVGVLFMGTLTGMLVAVMSGLFLSVILTVCKRLQQPIAPGTMKAIRAKIAPTTPIVFAAGLDPTEFDTQGNWIYNTRPYVN